jgi:hypothetical protein
VFRKGSQSAAAKTVGARGGRARARALSAADRKRIARLAAKARWAAYIRGRASVFGRRA